MPASITATAAPSSLDPSADVPGMIAPEPLRRASRKWTTGAGPTISLLILGAVAYQLRTLDLRQLLALLPASPFFWLVFLLYYCASPASEWLIFRRLWALPAAGFQALLRKRVSNELLLGYLGEVYFYAWARRHAHIVAAPFGAIKDVAILSAVAGNVFTLLLVLVTAPLLRALPIGLNGVHFTASAVVILTSSLAIFGFRRKLFTLPRRELWFVISIHSVRIVISILLAALMWHLVLPTVELAWWLVLGTLRQLLSRLPFLPNKDVIFAGVASFLVGTHSQIPDAVALVSALIVAAHLVVGALLGPCDMVRLARG